MPQQNPHRQERVLSWENLEIGYNGRSLVYPFCGEISTPGIYAILGQNGCGKSTLLKTWLGLIPPKNGKITLHNTPLSNHHGISQGIAYVPQFHMVNKYFHISVSDFIRQGFGPNHKLTESDTLNISQLLEDWQLAGYANKSFHELSGGQKVRCMLVRAILSNPKLLFLDEPLASLDICCQQQLMDTLEDLVTKKQVFVFMVDHHFENHAQYITARMTFHRHHDDSMCSVISS
ncbi:MAG: ABC transporter ATP-binding protein [Bdellovibrionota bacterium]